MKESTSLVVLAGGGPEMCRKVVEWCRERQRQLDLANLAAVAAEHVERRSLSRCSLKEVRLLGQVAVRALHVRVRWLSH